MLNEELRPFKNTLLEPLKKLHKVPSLVCDIESSADCPGKLHLIPLPILLQSTVQLGLDFLSPESLGEAVRMAEEIRGLPNTHDAKLQMLEV